MMERTNQNAAFGEHLEVYNKAFEAAEGLRQYRRPSGRVSELVGRAFEPTGRALEPARRP